MIQLAPNPGSTHRRLRLGRGISAGKGKTCGRGHKGQYARTGKRQPYVGFAGGQTPMQRQLPKRGFRSLNRSRHAVVNLAKLAALPAGSVVNRDFLVSKGLVPSSTDTIKILGEGTITVKLTVQVDEISDSAKQKIEAAGGNVTLPAVSE